MKHLVTEAPYKLTGGAWYPHSKKLVKALTKKDRFGKEYRFFLYDMNEDAIVVPRNLATVPLDKNNDKRLYGKQYEWDSGFIPRDEEQSRLVSESVALLRQQQNHIIQAPTGFGKTWVGSAIIQQVGRKACVITTKEDIMPEWRAALSRCLNIDPDEVGMWRGDTVPNNKHQAVVALVQSVCKGYTRYPQELYQSFGMVMVDEVQRMGAEKFSEAMYYFPAKYRVGLSATPYRKDGRDVVFHAHIGQIDVISEKRNLIPKIIQVDTGWKVPIVWNWEKKVHEPLFLEWGRVSTVTKHFKEDERRTATMVNFLKAAVAKGRNTVVFSDTVEYLSIIKDACVASGLQDDDEMFGYYCGLQADVYKKGSLTKQEQRDKAKVARICLATYKMCSEATDVPWWDTAVLATPKADVEQPIGRILREYEGKKDPVVLDLCDFNHHVLATFAGARSKWYEKIGAEVIKK